jgi:hypothetical protein
MLSKQGREPYPLCSRFGSAVETSDHVYRCSKVQAVANQRSFLPSFLSSLLSAGAPIYIISTFEYKLSITLDIPFPTFDVHVEVPSHTKTLLFTAFRHQDIIGWGVSYGDIHRHIGCQYSNILIHVTQCISLQIGIKSLCRALLNTQNKYSQTGTPIFMVHQTGSRTQIAGAHLAASFTGVCTSS